MTQHAVRTRIGQLAIIAALAFSGGHAWAGSGHSHSRHSDAAHVHGAGELEVVLEGKGLSISLYSPLENVLGFEHSPRTDAEKVKARRVKSLLQANGMFAFSPEAQCKRTSYTLYSDVLDPHGHGANEDHQHHGSEDGHADFRSVYEFACAEPAKLKVIDVRVFRQFPGFEKIEVQALLPKGQTGAILTPKQSKLVIQ